MNTTTLQFGYLKINSDKIIIHSNTLCPIDEKIEQNNLISRKKKKILGHFQHDTEESVYRINLNE